MFINRQCTTVLLIAGSVACGHAEQTTEKTNHDPATPPIPQVTAFEKVPEGEAANIDETVDLTVKLQNMRAEQDETQEGRVLRGVHAKSHGCVEAEFQVHEDIAEKYRVGLFATPGKRYDAWIRFSNAAVLREDDLKLGKDLQSGKEVRENGSRGMAIKIMAVEGEMIDQDNNQSEQDFLMINTPEFAFANVRDYLRLNRILERSPKGDDPKSYFFPALVENPRVPKELKDQLKMAIERDPLLNNLSDDEKQGTRDSLKVVEQKIKQETVRNPMQVPYFGAAPFLFGAEHIMKFSAAPCTTIEQEKFEVTADHPSQNYLSEALNQTMQGSEDVCYDFRINVHAMEGYDPNIDELNIEDATTSWHDEAANSINVAKITIKVPQEPHTQEAIEHCEKLAFSPWHSLAAHQPIGGINRLRRQVYSESAANRNAEGYGQ